MVGMLSDHLHHQSMDSTKARGRTEGRGLRATSVRRKNYPPADAGTLDHGHEYRCDLYFAKLDFPLACASTAIVFQRLSLPLVSEQTSKREPCGVVATHAMHTSARRRGR